MTNKWNGSILRKSNMQTTVVAPENESTRGADLLVFGYSCKIFRDDEKAQYIDQGKHLISMGDKSLKIDRYDVRAALSDLSKYEPPPGGYTNRLDCLTPAEQRAEQLCEEERYYSLYHNDEEEQMYQEEELKRLHLQGASSYGQVQFDYNRQQQKNYEIGANEDKMEEVDEVFVVPHGLNVPANLSMPTTMKQHAIIEKTAKFISTQGPQMEILIKAKQSNNPQFEFLNQNNQLNPYYKFVLNSFKSGTYPEETTKAEQENRLLESKPAITDSNSRNSYSAPDHSFTKPSTPIPIIKYRPSADCAYTQLISKIKGVPIPEMPDELSIEASQPDYQSNSVVGQQQESKSTLVVPTQSSSTEQRSQKVSETVEVKKISSGLMLAQCYASDTEDESDSFETEATAVIIDPPEHLQTIIDKTAIYVAKNGKQFEEILRTKEDDRFEFLDPWNEFYPYYLHKVTNLNPNYRPTKRNDKTKAAAPVSFSIKSKDESSVPINPALLQGTSDDENEHKSNAQNQASDSNGAGGQNNQTADAIAIPTPNALLAAATAAKINAAIANAQNSNSSSAGGSHMTTARSRFDIDNTGTVVSRNLALNSMPIGKIDASQQKELKRAEEKVKDRLAQIAREKLGLISKEKQLQLERKKKAMAFLNQIKGSKLTVSSSTFVPRVAQLVSKEDSAVRSESGSDTDTSSVHSIPITIGMNNENNEENNSEEKHQKSWERLKPSEIPFDADDNDVKPDDDQKSSKETKRHRSRSKSSSHRHHKKKKSKHSKKKSKKRSHSRSPSPSPDREHKKSKRSSSRKSKKRRKEHD